MDPEDVLGQVMATAVKGGVHERRVEMWENGVRRALDAAWVGSARQSVAQHDGPEDALRSLRRAVRQAVALTLGDDTEVGTAGELVLTNGWRMRWVQSEMSWYIYDDGLGLWKREDREGASGFAIGAGQLRKPSFGGPVKKVDMAHARQTLNAAKPMLAVTSAVFDRFPTLLNTPAGVFDIETEKLERHTPSAMLSMMTGAAIRPDAVPSKLWLSHLRRLCHGDEEKVRLLQIAAGAALYGGSDKPQQFVFLRGQGRNGKGVFVRILKKALGNYFMELSRGLLTQRDDAIPHEVVRLRNVRMVVCMEAPRERINVAALNSLTGGDELIGRRLHQNLAESFRPGYLPLWICGNEGLALDGKGNEALWERCVFVDVGSPIPAGDRDDTVEPRLGQVEELEGVLAWCLEGWRMFRANGGRIPVTEAGAVFVETARAEGDAFALFCRESLETSAGAELEWELVRMRFRKWCEEHGRVWSDPMVGALDMFGPGAVRKGSAGTLCLAGARWREGASGFGPLLGGQR